MERETILISLIDPSPLNPRKTFDEVKLQELAESAKAHGILQPILVRPRLHTVNRGPTKGHHERFELVDGERRWRAAQLAGLTEIPAIVRELSDKEVLEIALVTCEQRADVPELEKARGYKKLIDEHGYTADTLAAKIGRSPATIYGLLKLLQLPKAAAQALEAGELPANTALLFARIPNEKLRAQAYKEICGGREIPSLREAKERIQSRFMIELKQAPFDQKTSTLLISAGACTQCPKQVGNNRTEFPEGRADVCTDPACYQKKVEAHGVQLLHKAQDEGREVLSVQRSKEIFDTFNGHDLKYGAGYVDLDQTCPDHRNSWRKQLGKEAKEKIVLAIDPKGRAHELVPRPWAEAHLRKSQKNGTAPKDPYREENRKREARIKERKEMFQRALEHVAEDMERRLATLYALNNFGVIESLRLLLPLMIEASWSDAKALVEKRRGCEKGHLADWIGTMNAAQLLALWAELIAARKAVNLSSAYGPNLIKEDKAFFAFFGADLDDIAADLQEAKKKPPAKPPADGHASKNGKVPKPFHVNPNDLTLEEVRLNGQMWGNLTRPLACLEKAGIVTVAEARGLEHEKGTSLEDALATITGVGKPAAAAIADGIARALGESRPRKFGEVRGATS